MSAMRKVATVTLAGQVFDLATGERETQTPSRPQGATGPLSPREGDEAFARAWGVPVKKPHAALAREGEDIYGRPVAVEVELESELQAIGNVAFVESLLLLLATTIQERDAALAAAQRAES